METPAVLRKLRRSIGWTYLNCVVMKMDFHVEIGLWQLLETAVMRSIIFQLVLPWHHQKYLV